MSEVIVTQANYDWETLRPAVFKMMASLDSHRMARGANVLIKPNLLLPAAPDRAVLTHPLVTRAVAEYVIEQGGRPPDFRQPGRGCVP